MDEQNQNGDNSDTNVQDIINRLKQSSNAGLSFEEAKEKLISLGYSEAAITQVADDFQYGSQQVSDIPNKVSEYFQKHPDQAIADGDNLLKAQRKEDLADERNQAILDAAASRAAGELGVGNLDAQVEYESKFAFDVGVSFWLLVGLGIIINVAAYFIVTWLNISNLFYIVNGTLSLLLIIYLIKRMK